MEVGNHRKIKTSKYPFTQSREKRGFKEFAEISTNHVRDVYSLEPSGDTSDRGQRSLPDGSTALEEEAEKKDDDNSAQIANPPPAEPTAPAVIANDPLFSWIAQERFPLFIKVSIFIDIVQFSRKKIRVVERFDDLTFCLI